VGINIRTAQVKVIRALGYKNSNVPPTVSIYELADLPIIGIGLVHRLAHRP